MKKRLLSLTLALVMCLSLLPPTAFAAGESLVSINDTNFPDANFLAYVKTLPGADDDVFTETELADITEINCNGWNKPQGELIADLTGIEYFTALSSLDCSFNKLTELDISKNTELLSLNYSCNQLTSLDLNNNTKLGTLNCGGNNRTVADGTDLTVMDPNFDPDKAINIVGGSFAGGTVNFTADELTYDYSCSNKWNLPFKLIKDKTAPAPQELAIDKTNFPDANFRAYVKTLPGANDNIFTRAELAAITEINYNGWNKPEEEKIASLTGIEYFTALTDLNCPYNKLTNLDVTQNTALAELDCSYNQLTGLDLSKNTELTMLDCVFNKLTELNLSQNTYLSVLMCGINDLSSLNLSNNINLVYLDSENNELTSLDLSKNAKLNFLYCSNNQLTSLDLGNTTQLGTLNCSSNQLTSLDVSQHTALTDLNCSYNELTSLDLSKNAKLTDLTCSYNQLASLNLSNNLNLDYLDSENNQLTSLDLSKNAKLERLFCSNNQLTSLDLGNTAQLGTLNCSSNQLTSLDVSQHTALTNLDCSNNQLTSLDLSKNSKLTDLTCHTNQRTVGNGTALTAMDPNFVPTKASSIVGGSFDSGMVNFTADELTYDYDCGGGKTVGFKLVKAVPVVTEATITFKVVNGTWKDSTTVDKTVQVTLSDGKGTLAANQVPTDMIPNPGYENGAWDVTPNTTAGAVTENVTYTYIFTKKETPPAEDENLITVVFAKPGLFRKQTTTLTVAPGESIQAPNANGFLKNGYVWLSEDGTMTVDSKGTVTYAQLLELLGGTIEEGAEIRFNAVRESQLPKPEPDPESQTITVTFTVKGFGASLAGTRGKTLTVALEPGQTLTAPLVKSGFFGRTKSVTWISDDGFEITSGDEVDYDTLAQSLGGDVTGGAEVHFRKA